MPRSEVNREPKLDRREAFRAAASHIDATFVEGKRSSEDQVHFEHGPWKVILDVYVVNNGQNPVRYTRVRALYVAKEDFTLRISPRNVFTRIAELFGFSGLLVGDRELDRKYTLKSSNEPRGRSLLTDRRLRELIMVQPSLRLEILRLPWGKRRRTGDGVRAVAVQTTGVIKEPERLANYILLVATTLDQLVRIGAAHHEPVGEERTYLIGRRV